jgi:hypothetical protein
VIYTRRMGEGSMNERSIAEKIVEDLTRLKYGHLEIRICTAESPMPMEDKDKYRWNHPDAVKLRNFFNLILRECPNCGLTYTCLERKC